MESLVEKVRLAGLKLLHSQFSDKTYKAIVLEAVKLVAADYGSIFLLDNDALKKMYTTLPSNLKNLTPRKKGIVSRVLKTKKPFIVEGKLSNILHPALKRAGIKSYICLPFLYKNKAIGVISLHSNRKEHFTKSQIKTLELFLPLATFAIQKVKLGSELKESQKIRDNFISLASHELRTPLTTISGYTQLLFRKFGKENSSQGRWVRELLWENIRLEQIINELVEINRIKMGHFHYVWKVHSFKEIIKKTLENFYFRHPGRQLILKDSMPKEKNIDLIVGDFDKLVGVFTSFLDKAIRFSPKNKKIKLTFGTLKKQVKIAILSKGREIKKEDLPPSLQEFYHKEESPKVAMGIGVFISQHVIKQHKGILKITSDTSEESSIEIRLPKIKLAKSTL